MTLQNNSIFLWAIIINKLAVARGYTRVNFGFYKVCGDREFYRDITFLLFFFIFFSVPLVFPNFIPTSKKNCCNNLYIFSKFQYLTRIVITFGIKEAFVLFQAQKYIYVPNQWFTRESVTDIQIELYILL